MTWNKATLRTQFARLDRDARDQLTDFLFARFILIEYAEGYVGTEPLRIVLKRALQLFNNPEKMAITVTAECPECKTRFKMEPEDPIYVCPNCAQALDRCDWLVAMVYDYMKREILEALIEHEPEKANDLLKRAGNIPDQRFTDALVANFQISFLESLRNTGVPVPDELFERSRERAVALSWAGLFEIFSNITEEISPSKSASLNEALKDIEKSASSPKSNDRKEDEHESSNR